MKKSIEPTVMWQLKWSCCHGNVGKGQGPLKIMSIDGKALSEFKG